MIKLLSNWLSSLSSYIGINIDISKMLPGSFNINDGDICNDNNNDIDFLKNGIKVKGISNLKNTCYLNVILQMFATSETYVKYIYKLNSKKRYYFLNEMLKCMISIRNSKDNTDTYNPQNILKYIEKYGNNIDEINNQQDSHELFNTILTLTSNLDISHSEYSLVPKDIIMNDVTKNENPFNGFFCTTLTCQTCSRKRPLKHEIFNSVLLSIPEGKNNLTLNDCLDFFVTNELLEDKIECLACSLQKTKNNLLNRIKIYESIKSEELKVSDNRKLSIINNKFSCGETDEYIADFDEDILQNNDDDTSGDGDNTDDESLSSSLDNSAECALILKVRSTFKKQVLFSRLPLILCITINRKSYHPLTGREQKNFKYIQFPMELDMSPYFITKTTKITYLLQSVICHEGDAMNGHYSIFTRSYENKSEWKWIPDSIVQSVPNINAIFQHIKAYMLIYRKT